MKKLNFEAPINNLSLGNVSINFLRVLKEKDLQLNLYPIGDKGEFEAYDNSNNPFNLLRSSSILAK